MYYDDSNELGEQPGAYPPGLSSRARRDVAGLVLLLTGAACTLGAAAIWRPESALFLAGAYLIAVGWFVASGSGQ